jgi:hypothetical protein
MNCHEFKLTALAGVPAGGQDEITPLSRNQLEPGILLAHMQTPAGTPATPATGSRGKRRPAAASEKDKNGADQGTLR